MKKILFLFTVLATVIFMSSCSSCSKKKEEIVPVPAKLNVEKLVNEDKGLVGKNYSEFNWFETTMVLVNYLDEDNDGTLAEVVNIFQVVVNDDPQVIINTHTPDTNINEIHYTFVLENHPIEGVKLTFEQAFERLNAANYPKPHSRMCVLRKEIGPVSCNPQYVFGNTQAQVFVDAVTGEVSDENPARKGFELTK